MPHPHHHSIRPHSRRLSRTGRDPDFALYEYPLCYCDGVPCLCPDTGAIPETDFLTVFPGWNVWDIYQTKDLDFSLMMLGVSRDRQLRIFVEDAVRLGAPGALVADSIDLKGGQVEILPGPVSGLVVDKRRPNSLLVNGPSDLRTVRFFNRGEPASMAWPHNDNYLLDATYQPSQSNPATQGPGPSTIGGTIGGGIVQPIGDLAKGAGLSPGTALVIGAVVLGGILMYSNRGSILRRVKRGRSKT